MSNSNEDLAQDFKELNLYIDDIYDYYIRNKGKDAGNLWIQFSDKFRHFETKIKSEWQSKNQPLPIEGDTFAKLITDYGNDLNKQVREFWREQHVGNPQTSREISAQMQGYEDGYNAALKNK